MSEIVVDASVALCWFVREAETIAANRRASPFVTLDRAFVAGVAKTPYARDVVHLSDWA